MNPFNDPPNAWAETAVFIIALASLINNKINSHDDCFPECQSVMVVDKVML